MWQIKKPWTLSHLDQFMVPFYPIMEFYSPSELIFILQVSNTIGVSKSWHVWVKYFWEGKQLCASEEL